MMSSVLKAVFALAFAGGTIISCATTSKIESKPDTFTGGTTSTTDYLPVVPSPKQELYCGNVDLCIRFKKSSLKNVVSYEATVHDGGEFARPVNAVKTDSLQFNIDGKIHSLSTEVDGASSETIHGGVISAVHSQTIPYRNIDPSVMDSLAQAKVVRVRLKGAGREKTGFLRPISFEAIGNLIAAP